ncbi:MAG: ABC transporter ATP-binding protein [Deltaproteobacteria bacterium]|nr:ABC transporter ATP-binding protein [Deltaproteobacteria bacterium]
MSALVNLKDVSLRFRLYNGYSGLKEAAMRVLSAQRWHKLPELRKREFWGLRHIDLQLKEGDRIGIIGQNGAGKSSLLKVISKIYRPTEGAVTVSGRLAPLIEIGAGFNPELSGRENAYLNGSILGLKRSVIQERLNSIIEFSELSDFFDVPVKYYSTGMHLRLAYTIATEVSPDILILDELYAGGDAAFIERASQRLERFVNQSKILILVSHNLEYVEQFCNRAIVLHHGEIRAQGLPKQCIEQYLHFCQGDMNAYA